MKASIETNHIDSDRVSQSRNHKVILHDLNRIEDIHQIKLSLVSLTRKMTGADTNRQMALIEVIKTLATLEKAQDLIRSAQTN